MPSGRLRTYSSCVSADVQQFDLLSLFTANRGLRSACAFQRKAWRFLNIFAQSMTIEGDNQRQRIGMDELDAVFVVNILLPEGRQVHFNRVEIVTPLVGIVGCNAVAGNGARYAQNGVTLGVQVERYGAALAPVGPGESRDRFSVSRYCSTVLRSSGESLRVFAPANAFKRAADNGDVRGA